MVSKALYLTDSSEIIPGEGKGYPLQYSGLENSMGCVVHGVAKSQTWLSDFHSHSRSEIIIEDWKRSQFNKHLIEYLHVCVCVCVYSVVQSCLTLCDPMHYSPPGSPVHGILQARILGWVAISSSRRSFPLRDWTCIFCTGRKILYYWATESGKPKWILTMC